MSPERAPTVPAAPDPELDRRAFLGLFGLGAGAAAGLRLWAPRTAALAAGGGGEDGVFALADGTPRWTPVALPIPAHGDGGSAETDRERLARYVVEDTLKLPAGYRFDVVARWGDAFGPAGDAARAVRFGTNADWIGLVPMPGREGELWMVVNHEYVSARPWIQGYREAHGEDLPELRVSEGGHGKHARLVVDGHELDGLGLDLSAPDAAERCPAPALAAIRRVCRAALDDLGVSVLHVRRDERGRIAVVRDSALHHRISGAHPTTPTFGNCSGGTTTWGTALTCEENYQDQVQDEVDARGELVASRPKPFEVVEPLPGRPEPTYFNGLGQGLTPPLDGRDFGWVVHVDPAAGRLRKLRALGRFRHENAAVRCEGGKRLAVYMGDDRRGGHVWKFLSDGAVRDPSDPANVEHLERGTLHCARFEPDSKGRWIPLLPETPLARPRPEHTAEGHLWLPDRRPSEGRPADGGPRRGRVAVRAPHAKQKGLSPDEWVASVEQACGRPFDELTLGDLVWDPAGAQLEGEAKRAHRLAVLRLEAYAMANAAGGTPTARPEDLELHPLDRSLYLAFTDASGSSEGSPDARVFPDSGEDSSRQYGAIYRLFEREGDPAALEFGWGRFVSSGELCDGGGGFACADNLAFDPQGNLWMVCDIATERQNVAVDREQGTRPGKSAFRGVFGNNALFLIPTRGPLAGKPHCFGIGPMECELTGLTFSPDGRAMLVSVQHPGELNGARGRAGSGPDSETRKVVLADRAGRTFEQQRVVPLGSNFPSGERGAVPRACVVCITREG